MSSGLLVGPASPPIMIPEVKQSGWKKGRKDRVSETCLAAMWLWTGHRPHHCSGFLIRTENDTTINGSQAKWVPTTFWEQSWSLSMQCAKDAAIITPTAVLALSMRLRHRGIKLHPREVTQLMRSKARNCIRSASLPGSDMQASAPLGCSCSLGPSPLLTLIFCEWYYAHCLTFLCLLYFICKLEKINSSWQLLLLLLLLFKPFLFQHIVSIS